MALMVSVSGVRGLVGRTLTPQVALEFAQAYGTVLRGGRVVLGRDTRPSGEMFSSAVQAGLLAAGCHVTSVGVAMTPTIGRAILDGKYDGGVVITASHNPPPWNGIKFLDQRGLAPDAARAAEIARVRESGRLQMATEVFRPVQIDTTAGRRHVDAVLAAVEVDLSTLRGLRVVLDSVNGAGCQAAPWLLSELGCEVIHINAEPNGQFAHPPEPIEENLGQLCDAVRRHEAAVGFAQDPDADRLAIVDETGRYIGEEYTLAFSVLSVLSRRPGPVAINLSTSGLCEHVARRFGARVHRTPVGEANVARGMVAHGCIIGGEGNGGVIDPRICWVRDSLSAMSLVLQLLAATGKTVAQLVDELPRLTMIKRKFDCPPQNVPAVVERTAAAFGNHEIDRSDGVWIRFDEGWAHLRGSNTEPILRIIAEASTPRATEALIERVRTAAGI